MGKMAASTGVFTVKITDWLDILWWSYGVPSKGTPILVLFIINSAREGLNCEVQTTPVDVWTSSSADFPLRQSIVANEEMCKQSSFAARMFVYVLILCGAL